MKGWTLNQDHIRRIRITDQKHVNTHKTSMPEICTFKYARINRICYQVKVKNQLFLIFEKHSSNKISKKTWLSIEFYNFQRVHRIAEKGLKDALKNLTFKTVNSKAAFQESKQVRLGCQHLCNPHQQQTKNQIRIHLSISQQVVTVAQTWWETSPKCSIKTNRTSLTLSPFKQVLLNQIIEAQKL